MTRMYTRLEKILLLVVAVALVAAPLRGGFAIVLPGDAGSASHCAHAEHAVQGMAHSHGMHAADGGLPERDCQQGCTGACCDGACGTCAHTLFAPPDAVAVTNNQSGSVFFRAASQCQAGRTVNPPFRPPILFS